MNVDVLIPFRPGSEPDPGHDGRMTDFRSPLCDWVRRFWEARDFHVLIGDSPTEPFTRGHAINALAARSDADVFVLGDADTVVTADVQALAKTLRRHEWAIGYPLNGYYSLTRSYTRLLLEADPADELPFLRQHQFFAVTPRAVSGCLVVPREAFEAVSGFDRRFIGWGSEDFAFQVALDTLWGPHHRAKGSAWHLFHPHVEAARFDQPHFRANEALCHRYERIRGNRAAMAELIGEQHHARRL